jgi:hypothetical protein
MFSWNIDLLSCFILMVGSLNSEFNLALIVNWLLKSLFTRYYSEFAQALSIVMFDKQLFVFLSGVL